VAGLRGNYYFRSEPGYGLFAGLEADYVSFKGEVSDGTGIAVEPFVGGEYFFAKDLSLQLDFGPALLMLQDKNVTNASVNGLEYVVNFGVNYYF
jgi:YHS domain-containing protein